jgi:enoyl-[acyl-carrier protein] reductase I
MAAAQKTALIMGVANRRSIAWACVQSFLSQNYRVVFTYQNERHESTALDLKSNHPNIHALPCNVEHEIPILFQEKIPELLGEDNVSLNAIVHSIAFAPDIKTHSLLETSRHAFQVAHDVSTYSFLQVAQEALPLLHPGSSLTALSYLGAVKAMQHYNVMGPAEASLESVVRGLALELGSSRDYHVRVNAVSAGPLNTLAARGIAGISDIRKDVMNRAPLKRNVTAEEVADTIFFLATQATGITGQTVYVDGGYSIVAGP